MINYIKAYLQKILIFDVNSLLYFQKIIFAVNFFIYRFVRFAILLGVTSESNLRKTTKIRFPAVSLEAFMTFLQMAKIIKKYSPIDKLLFC